MSTEPYPEVSVDELGIVPPQGARAPEWPKKLRTLTAAELDRLTIDNSGRFYWDGKLVNYDTQPRQLTDSNSLDHSMDILDRASYELGGRKMPATIEGEIAKVEAARNGESRGVDLETIRREVAAALAEAQPYAAAETTTTTTIQQKHLTLTPWQKLGAIIVVVAIAVGAFGAATYGYVAARDWGCRIGAFEKGCPTMDGRPRVDIPA